MKYLKRYSCHHSFLFKALTFVLVFFLCFLFSWPSFSAYLERPFEPAFTLDKKTSIPVNIARDLHYALPDLELVALKDSEIKNMLASARNRFGFQSNGDLLGLFQYCSDLKTHDHGMASELKEFVVKLKNPQTLLESSEKTYTQELVTHFDKICISNKLNRIEMVLNIIHELTHVAYPNAELELIQNIPVLENYDDYFKKDMVRVGGEAHAFRLQVKALLQLRKIKPVLEEYDYHLLRFFNPADFKLYSTQNYLDYFRDPTQSEQIKSYYENSTRQYFNVYLNLHRSHFEALVAYLRSKINSLAYPQSFLNSLEVDYQDLVKKKSDFEKKWPTHIL